MKTIRNKLKNIAGESIGEVLVALLISSLALVMLASMITTSSRLVANSREKMSAYYDANKILSKQTASSTEGALTFSSSVPLTEGNAAVPVYIYKNDTFSAIPILAYRKK